jgi:hypothetical protein
MYASYSAWLMLEDLCKKHFGLNDQSPEFLGLYFADDTLRIDRYPCRLFPSLTNFREVK